jgi:sirohydrochlorin cobaltochelatase
MQRVQARLRALVPDARVELAFLELMSPSLDELVPELVAEGYEDICVVPAFMAQTGHLKRDLPTLFTALRASFPGVQVRLAPAIGESEQVQAAIADYALSCLRPQN